MTNRRLIAFQSKQMRGRVLEVGQVCSALLSTGGIINSAARQLGVGRNTLSNFIKNTPDAQSAIVQAKEDTLDIAETRLREQVIEGSPRAVEYYLSRQGKERGYSQRQEITGADGEAVFAPVIQAKQGMIDKLEQLLLSEAEKVSSLGDEPDDIPVSSSKNESDTLGSSSKALLN